jgi:hypothetical protein
LKPLFPCIAPSRVLVGMHVCMCVRVALILQSIVPYRPIGSICVFGLEL